MVYQSSFSGGIRAGGSAWVETSCEAGCTPADTAGAATSNSAGAATSRLRGPASRVLSWYSSVRRPSLATGVHRPKHHLATPAGQYRLLRQPYLRQAGVRQVRNQTERQQLFPRDCVPVQRSNPLTTRTRCGGWRLPLKLSGQTSAGQMFWFCTSMTLYIIICCHIIHKGVPFCQVRWAQKIQI